MLLEKELLVGGGILFAAMVQGCTGFGFAMAASPMLMLFLPASAVVPVIVSLSTINTLLVTWECRQHIEKALLLPLVIGASCGLPVGMHILRTLSNEYLKIFVGIIAVAFALLALSGWSYPIRQDYWVLIPLGFVSGILGSSTSMGGPPIALFLSNQKVPKDVFRATLISYFLTINGITVGLFSFAGLISFDLIKNLFIYVPIMIFGTFIGIRIARGTTEHFFRILALVVVLLMGFVLIGTNARAVTRW